LGRSGSAPGKKRTVPVGSARRMAASAAAPWSRPKHAATNRPRAKKSSPAAGSSSRHTSRQPLRRSPAHARIAAATSAPSVVRSVSGVVPPPPAAAVPPMLVIAVASPPRFPLARWWTDAREKRSAAAEPSRVVARLRSG
jgi:hypothetical protein